MRAIVAVTVILLGASSAAPEPEYAALIGDHFHAVDGKGTPSLLEIESSSRRSDRLAVASAHLTESSRDAPDLTISSPLLAPAEVPPQDAASEQASELSLDELCNALLTSAQDNNLPVQFFANLIWQESKLRDDAVSPVGALGIAQFMPQTAMASGLDDPFDPFQAIPASARLLRELRTQFGNLGYAAAAYNAGARRVSDWLDHGRALPRQTLNYVLLVTGRSAQQWRTTPPSDNALTFVRRLPCREMPAFAELEEAQAEQPIAKPAVPVQQTAEAEHTARRHVAERKPPHGHGAKETIRIARREGHDIKHHAERAQHAAHRA
jgi:soluble lytic murein transglycosylase-like protein